jgi:hypothetical protein
MVSDLEISNFSQGQANPQIDTDIVEKGHFRMETRCSPLCQLKTGYYEIDLNSYH